MTSRGLTTELVLEIMTEYTVNRSRPQTEAAAF